jgi:integrase
MARPPLPLGTMGEIRCYAYGKGRYRAMAKYRDFDGVTRQVERTGTSKAAARRRLTEACRDRGRTDAHADITPDTKVKAVAEFWFRELELAVEAGDRSPGTARSYRDRLDNQVIPAIGELRLREVTVSRVDGLLKVTRQKHGVGVAKLTRTVLSGVLGLAARHDALTGNPVRDAGAIRTPQKICTALSLEEVWDLRAKLVADPQAVTWDLPEFADMMMATGLRIGETSAITWAALDLDAGLVEVRGTVIRIKGKGLIIDPVG